MDALQPKPGPPVRAGTGLAEWRRGWPTLIGSAVGMGSGISLFANANGFFVKPLAHEFGWSRGQIAISSAGILLTSLAMPWVGAMVDRRGPRPFVLAGAVLFALSYIFLSIQTGAFWMYLAVVLMIGLAAGPATAPLVFTRPLVNAFTRSRGLALSIGLSGSAFLSITLLPALQHTIASYGWRAGYGLMAVAGLGFGLASYYLLGLRRPAPDLSREDIVAAPAPRGHTLGDAVKDPRFWLLGGGVVSVTLAGAAFDSQFQPLLSDIGVPGPTAALLGAWYAASTVLGRLIGGALLDRLWPPGVAFVALCGPAAGMLMMLLPSHSQLALSTALVGFSQGAEGNILGFFAARYFGLKAFGVIFGVLGLGFGVAYAIGGVSAGYAFDYTGNYQLMLKVGSVLTAVGATGFLASGLLPAKSGR